ncbi:hypothetical protein OS493_024427 [Desmophyllum pertusum]|uniref:DBH-like monooxygenase protein 1 n=1 Tax=Desmophyllum pertusum TaxID=174260 RepID=A0A9W9YLT8_9CNID|nr:hypothetical protein OS493_024427 [Desmophyllum pertusum]
MIKEGNEGLVHHYAVYGCHGGFTENDFHGGVKCFATWEMYTKCQKFHMITVWAVGLQAFYLPPHVGIPIGGNDSPNIFLLEVAYDNPQNIKGRQDSSGVNLYYTDKLRKYDSGLVSVGVDINDWQIVPPKQKDWISTGYCMHQCTESMFKSSSLPEGGIKVFATFMHIHSAGHANTNRS